MKKKEGEVLLLKEYTIILGGHKEKNKNNGIIANPNARDQLFETSLFQILF